MASSRVNIFQNGSRWLRADFHLHTNADKEFSYADAHDYYNSNYIDGLENSGINVGIISNHNKFAIDEFKSLRKTASKKEIYLLPGVELSVNDGSNGIHIVIVFSDEWLDRGQDYINQFLNVAFAGKAPNQYENENGRCTLSIVDTIKKLEAYDRDFFLICAHVENKSGLWNELDGGRLEELGKEEGFRKRVLGFQKVRTHDKNDTKCRVKVQQWLRDAYPAEVEGSDCKSINQIGQGRSCYLKIGDFTFEAIKFALIDNENRVANEPVESKHSHIQSISFDGGVLDGKSIYFSSELNALIGIRGSGKSSIIETIRYALDIPFGEKALDIDYKKQLVDHALGSGGRISVNAVDSRGQSYEIRRINKEIPDVYIDGKLQPGISIRETVLNKPIYFGQKDLSSTGEGFEKDLVEKLVGEKLIGIRTQIETQKQKVIESIHKISRLANTEEKKRDWTQKKLDAEFKLKFYKEYGVEEKLQKQVDFDTDDRKCSSIIKFVDEFLKSLKGFIDQYQDDFANQKVYTSKQNTHFFDELFIIYDKIQASFNKVQNLYSTSKEASQLLEKKCGEFQLLKEGQKEEFAKIERKLSEQLQKAGVQAIQPDEFRQLRKTVEQAEQMLNALDKEDKTRTEVQRTLENDLAELNDLWRNEYKIIQSELDKVNNAHDSLEIKAGFKDDKIAFVAFMKAVFRGSRIRETTFVDLAEAYSDFGSIYKDFTNAVKTVGALSQTFTEYFYGNLTALLVWQVPNKFIIEYRGKELKHHSLGQRASALILFVLSQQENDVFIIDQPEDDLDSQTIYEDVIKLVRKLKPNTQFIFATHNANFPVLGDAEQIVACSYSDDKVSFLSGSIDNPTLQKEVVDIMEGGEEAFKQRRRRYEIWNPQSF
ncbi:TrlF family AAA-like ATPase [Desulfovibrio inopinatus]|uniref:TrlF family AAA-like ATPase n=1 Tax=Desulfovibrio inopinatus TaxID=102109 RepID=UPI0003FE2BCA|nr:AAA family ATPase [Desulfovibrio inopinatus]